MKKITLLAFLTLAVVSLSALAQRQYVAPPTDEANPRYLLMDEADSSIVRGDYDEAAARLIDAISVCPDCSDNALILTNLGMVYAYDGRDTLALATLDRALEISPNLRTAITNRAYLLMNMGRNSEAKDAFSKVLATDSLNLEARYYRGFMALYTSDLATAEQDFDMLRTHAPDDLNTARALSTLYVATGSDDLAVPYLERLIKDDSDQDPENFAVLASIYLSQRKLTEASSVIGSGIEKFPEYGELYLDRAWLNKLLFRPRESRDDTRRARSLGVSERRIRRILDNID